MIRENKIDLRKFKCAAGPCHAPLPEVYCERIMIQRREIPPFIELLNALGDDTVLSYHILPPRQEDNSENPGMDRTWVFIWVDPRKHHDPQFLVQAASNIACKGFTVEQELDYLNDKNRNEWFGQTCREVNCPVCVSNYPQERGHAMTHYQYMKALATAVGIFY
jgi:hypothetical protein